MRVTLRTESFIDVKVFSYRSIGYFDKFGEISLKHVVLSLGVARRYASQDFKAHLCTAED